jgi:hypothetical protein
MNSGYLTGRFSFVSRFLSVWLYSLTFVSHKLLDYLTSFPCHDISFQYTLQTTLDSVHRLHHLVLLTSHMTLTLLPKPGVQLLHTTPTLALPRHIPECKHGSSVLYGIHKQDSIYTRTDSTTCGPPPESAPNPTSLPSTNDTSCSSLSCRVSRRDQAQSRVTSCEQIPLLTMRILR